MSQFFREVREFIQVYRTYRRGGNSRRSSFHTAFGCAFIHLPF